MSGIKRFLVLGCAVVLAVPANAQQPSYDGLQYNNSGYGTGVNGLPEPPPYVDDLTLLSGMIMRVQNLQEQADAALASLLNGQTAATRDQGVRDLVQLVGIADGVLAGTSWQNAVVRARASENGAGGYSARFLSVFGAGGALVKIYQEEQRLHRFLDAPPPTSAPVSIGMPPTPMKKEVPQLPTTLPPPPVATFAPLPTVLPKPVVPLPPTLPPPPLPTPSVTPSPTTTPTYPGEDIGAIQKKIDEIGIQLAKPGLTTDQKNVLEITRNAYVQRMAELVRQAPGAVVDGTPATLDGHRAAPAPTSTPATTATSSSVSPAVTSSKSVFLQSSGSTENRDGTTTAAATAPSNTSPSNTSPSNTVSVATPAVSPAVAAKIPLVPNSYGISPPIVTDAQIKAIMDPLMDGLLAGENAKLSGQGLTMNKYRQVTGNNGKSTIISAGRPDYDYYREWLVESPAMRDAVQAKVQQLYADQAKSIAATQPAPAPAPAGNPQAQTPGAAQPQNTSGSSGGLPPGSTLPNGKLDLPSSSANN